MNSSQQHKGLNILLSLQSKEAKQALSNIKFYLGAAGGAIHEHYVVHYDEKPETDNAGDPITYYKCIQIKKFMSK